jgi:hypothetical protein
MTFRDSTNDACPVVCVQRPLASSSHIRPARGWRFTHSIAMNAAPPNAKSLKLPWSRELSLPRSWDVEVPIQHGGPGAHHLRGFSLSPARPGASVKTGRFD